MALIPQSLQRRRRSGDERILAPSSCSRDCIGHAAGYRWAEREGIARVDDCRGLSIPFIEGCRVYVAEPRRGANLDDEGRPIVERRPWPRRLPERERRSRPCELCTDREAWDRAADGPARGANRVAAGGFRVTQAPRNGAGRARVRGSRDQHPLARQIAEQQQHAERQDQHRRHGLDAAQDDRAPAGLRVGVAGRDALGSDRDSRDRAP